MKLHRISVIMSLHHLQIVCHHVEGYEAAKSANAVDGDAVPVPHYGLVLSVPQVGWLAASHGASTASMHGLHCRLRNCRLRVTGDARSSTS